MRTSKKLGWLGLGLLCLALLSARGSLPEAEQPPPMESPLSTPAGETSAPVPVELLAPAAQTSAESLSLPERGEEEIRETTIQGGMRIKNETGYEPDLGELLRQGPPIRLAAEGPQILIIHTHGSEAYTPAGLDRYETEDSCRTEDERYNVIRVGDELAAIFEEAGLRVLHDREIYDYPSYTGSYARSGAAVEAVLAQYPALTVVIDLHRDALGTDDVIYKTMAAEEGVCASQVMLLVGTDESGLEHPHWQSNLALALWMQQAVDRLHPSLMRPVDLVPQRYNQQLCPGSVLLEVGSSGNTLQEALAAIRLFGKAVAPALLALAEQPPES